MPIIWVHDNHFAIIAVFIQNTVLFGDIIRILPRSPELALLLPTSRCGKPCTVCRKPWLTYAHNMSTRQPFCYNRRFYSKHCVIWSKSNNPFCGEFIFYLHLCHFWMLIPSKCCLLWAAMSLQLRPRSLGPREESAFI